MSKKRIFYIGFFVALAVLFYFVMTWIIPGYSDKQINPVSYVRPFAFQTQDGKTLTDKDMKGKVYVAEFFFTTCKGICPDMNNNMRKVYNQLKDEKDFYILSFTCDPETDSVARMKHYADSMKVDTRKWFFLTGRKDSLYKAARVSYTIDDPVSNLTPINEQFIHSQHWALVDKNGDVRKIYDGLKNRDIQRLIKEAKKLLDKKQEPATAS